MTAVTTTSTDGQADGKNPAKIPPVAAVFSRIAVIAIAVYAAAQVVSDVASVKVGVIASTAVDMGTFIYPITFTLRDVVHRQIGKSATQVLILTCAVTNFAMAGYFAWAANVPADPSSGVADEFAIVLGPLWRIVVASIIAEVVAELIDTEIYSWVVHRLGGKAAWVRVVASNAIAVPIDSFLFAVIAFGAIPFMGDHALTLPWSSVWQIFWANVWIKLAVTLVSSPLIYVGARKHAAELDLRA